MSRTETIEIANWSQLFENADFRKRQRLGWYLAPSGCESRGYRLLMRQGSDGLIAFGVFSALCQLMATLRKDTRESGKFINSDGTGMEPADLWEMTRIQPADFEKAVKLLSEVGWLILHSEAVTEEEKEICHSSATDLPPSCQSSAGFVKGEGEGEGEGEDPPKPPEGAKRDRRPLLEELVEAIPETFCPERRRLAIQFAEARQSYIPVRKRFGTVNAFEQSCKRMELYSLDDLREAIESAIAAEWQSWELDEVKMKRTAGATAGSNFEGSQF